MTIIYELTHVMYKITVYNRNRSYQKKGGTTMAEKNNAMASVQNDQAGTKELSPSEYFERVKGQKEKATDEMLTQVYDNCLELLNKYIETGQTVAAKKLIFHLETIEREREVIKEGIDTFVYRDEIIQYIQDVAKETVKIIDLKHYEREIPDEIYDAFLKVKDIFDQFYVVFTDYTGVVQRQIEKERRDKDPILFGAFLDEKSGTMIERMYFIGDWVDEYCDLTLDKMVNVMEKQTNKQIVRSILTPEDIVTLKEQLMNLEPTQDGFRVKESTNKVTITKKGLFQKVRTFFKE